jgi:hypothetical protein
MTPETLKSLAAKATPGPWIFGWSGEEGDGPGVGACGRGSIADMPVIPCNAHVGGSATVEQAAANGRFIAAVDPQTVLSLLERLERAEGVVCAAREARRQMIQDNCGPGVGGARWHLMQTLDAFDRASSGGGKGSGG